MGKMNLNKLTYEEIEERYIKFNRLCKKRSIKKVRKANRNRN